MKATMAFSPAEASPERAGDSSRGMLDPVTMAIMNKYGMATAPVQKTPDPPNQRDGLADFIGKYRLDAPNANIKSGFVSEPDSVINNTSSPIDLANTTSLSSSRSDDESSQYLWKVKHDGAFLNSTSFSSSHSNGVHTNPTQMLRRFNLKSSDEGDNSNATEKVTNHGSRYTESPGKTYSSIGSIANTPSFQAKLRNRLERVATMSSVSGGSPFRPISTSLPGAEIQNEVKPSSSNESDQVMQQMISREETSYHTGFASLHIGAPIEADVSTASSEEFETNSRLVEMIEEDAKSEEERTEGVAVVEDYSALSSNESKSNNGPSDEDEEESELSDRSNGSYSHEEHNEEESEVSERSNVSYSHQEQFTLGNNSNGLYDGNKTYNASSYDESEFNQMANITHSYQKFGDAKMHSASKVSAITMSGIGVDLRNDYTDGPKVLTPREAAGVSCTISSLVGGLFGKKGPVKKKTSVLDVVTMICSPLPDNVVPSPTVYAHSFESAEGTEVCYEEASHHDNSASDESDSSCGGSKQYRPRSNSRRPPSPESNRSSSDESESDETTLREDDDTMATMSTLTYSKVNYGGPVFDGYHRGPMGGLFASKRMYTPRYNGRHVRGSRYPIPSDEYDDEETQVTMSTIRDDDDTHATMSTLTYSKVGSLYGSNAVAGYHRGTMGGYYNRNIDARGYEEEDGWETCSRLTTSTFGIGTKPYRPQNYSANKSYRRFDSLRECSQSSGSDTYDGDDDCADTSVASFTRVDYR